MKLIKNFELIEKRSRFIGFCYNVNKKDEVGEILKTLKKKHKKAKHFAYAYKIDNLIRRSDDKEPANTAGTPILNIIEKKELNHCLIVVIRYFGGIKLGAGGLIRAYGKCANEATKSINLQ